MMIDKNLFIIFSWIEVGNSLVTDMINEKNTFLRTPCSLICLSKILFSSV